MPFDINAAPQEFECKLHEHFGDLECVEVLRYAILVRGSGDTLVEATSDHDENLLKLMKRAHVVNLEFNSRKLNLDRTVKNRSGQNKSCQQENPPANRKYSVFLDL